MIDTSNWKPFKMSQLFEIKKGKRLTKADQTPGETVFIGATSNNNGITEYIGQDPIHEGNTISVTYNGSVGEAFYQPVPYWASDDVNVLYPKGFDLNEKIGLFLCTVIRNEKQMWSYGRKWNKDLMNETTIRLPVTEEGNPNYSYMESYIDSLDDDISDIPDYFLSEGYERACWFLDNIDQADFEKEYAGKQSEKLYRLEDREWDYFRLEDCVDEVHNGKSYNASELTVAADGDDFIAYVTRTDQNNGISMYVEPSDYDGLEQGGAITIGDTTATIFYQDHCFITGPHIIVVRANWLNVFTAQFLISILNQEKYRYPVFGRAYTKDLIKETMLYLPVGDDGNPDYSFMEGYIKSCSFSCNIT